VEANSSLADRILSKARQLFFARGYPGTSLRAIAGAAATSESGILRIFGSKQGLLRAVYASCWQEINARVDAAIALAAQKDPDPRNLLVAVMQAVLRGYYDEPEMTTFVLSHFCYRETCGLTPLDDVNPAICEKASEEYHRYLRRVQELCEEVTRNHPAFARAGVHSVALAHAFISLVHGIQTGWYVAALEQTDSPQMTIDDALASAKLLLYH
jgi:AcrR family transcriptional regulator